MSPHATLRSAVPTSLRGARGGWLGLTLFLGALLAPGAEAAGVPVGFADSVVASGLTSPTAMTVMPDGRVLVVQQDGTVRMIKGDVLLPTPFYTVADVDSFAERGCLGIVADPAFITNRHVYLFCTVRDGASSHNRVLRVTAAGDTALPSSEQLILRLPDVPEGVKWHMGGALRFGPDGKLYVAVGGHEDQRVAEPVTSFSQRLDSPFGKILRINQDGTFPQDNPFVATPGAYSGIYALGLRNPFAFDVHPRTGLMYVNDVGSASWEEINRGAPGANYGWPLYEGSAPAGSGYVNAEYEYSHSVGCAVTGGAFYAPESAQFPAAYVDTYLFADFCSGSIYVLDPALPTQHTELVTGIGNPVNIGVAPDGSVYYLARNQQTGTPTEGNATVGKVTYNGTQLPRISTQPRSQTVLLGRSVTFSAAASGASSFQWQRDGVDLPGATSPSHTLPSVSLTDDQARFTVVVRNGFGAVTSEPAVLSVTTLQPPVARIDEPLESFGYADNSSIPFSGSATDAEDGVLPPSAFTWQIDFHHDAHSHPHRAAFSGVAAGTEALGEVESEANTWLRFSLMVRDSDGQTSSAQRDVHPRQQLSELTPLAPTQNGLGPFERNRTNGGETEGDGAAIVLDRIPYARGLGVHAPSELRYALSGACTGHFIADVGVPDGAGEGASVVFRVYADGLELFDSGPVTEADARKAVRVPVTGRADLRLVVTDAGNGSNSDSGVWGSARVTGCSTPAADGGTSGGVEPPPVAPATPATPEGRGCSAGGTGSFGPLASVLLLAALALRRWRRHGARGRAGPQDGGTAR